MTEDPSVIRKIIIKNYRCFESFQLDLNPHVNIVVGDNDAGKSTLLEAVNLALTFRLNGRKVAANELSPYAINTAAVRSYISGLASDPHTQPPEILIEVYLEDMPELTTLRGTNNSLQEDSPGVRFRAALSSEFVEEYLASIAQPADVRLVPTEYYDIEWLGFSGNPVSIRDLPGAASLIDASTIRLQSGADYYLQNIIETHLEKAERVELSRSYRSLREGFSQNESVQSVNAKLAGSQGDISDRTLSLAIDISHRFTWESSLVPHLDDLPFHCIGKGEQSTLKILLALNRRGANSHVVLVEEPENHLSFSTLNALVAKIADKCSTRQVLITTHSSYVLNKLGLQSLVLLSGDNVLRISDLSDNTEDYFKKLSGYDTLRLVLAKKVILVEGPSDELVVQRAYRDVHGHLPIEDGIDVLSVRGLSFNRFLDLAAGLGRTTAVVTDNDGKDPATVVKRYSSHGDSPFISIHVGEDAAYKTLEPQLLRANSRAELNAVLGTAYSDEASLLKYMQEHKTTTALAIFESSQQINMPKYILDAIA